MGKRVFKLPDLGEGTVEAEIVAWHVEVGDRISEDQTIVEVMTDKASVEVPAPVTGLLKSKTGEPGDVLAVGSELAVFETDDATTTDETTDSANAEGEDVPVTPVVRERPLSATDKPLASPAVRRLAKEGGIDLQHVRGTGPKGRIRKNDLEMATNGVNGGAGTAGPLRTGTDEIKIIGLRRKIAERMSHAVRTIPHFSYVEEVDVTKLESLRRHLNANADAPGERLTYLPFIMLALAQALRDFPQCNALHDAERNLIVRHHAVHVGIATQTDDGLKVPVVRHVEAMDLQAAARAAGAAAQAARDGSASREQLVGSTITVTSLGKLGGIVTTPVINAPEVAIIGVNKAVERPMVVDGSVAIRRIMNLSSSFDHRFVDGYDAAAMIQRTRSLLEHPATIFMAN